MVRLFLDYLSKYVCVVPTDIFNFPKCFFNLSKYFCSVRLYVFNLPKYVFKSYRLNPQV